MVSIRLANAADLDRSFELINQAKRHLKNLGIDQWQTGYPDLDTIKTDINDGIGFVMEDGERIIGYCCISFLGEKAYDNIIGEWQSLREYAVIHRSVIDDDYKGLGYSKEFFSFTEKLCANKGVTSIKIDTHPENFTMQHILKSLGFIYCGTITYDGDGKLAFEKLL